MADAGNPIKIGYKAISHGTNPTAVAVDDITHGYANRAGIPWVIGGHPNVVTREVRVLASDGAESDRAIITVSTPFVLVITRVSLYVSNDVTVDVACRVGFATGTLPASTLAGTDGLLLGHSGIPAGCGIQVGDGSGIVGIGGTSEDLRFSCDEPTGGSLFVVASGYEIS